MQKQKTKNCQNCEVIYTGHPNSKYGDYWHCNPSIYPSNFYNKTVQKTAEDIWKKDNAKYSFAKENGYDVLVIWEKDYKQNPEKIIKECLNYLRQ